MASHGVARPTHSRTENERKGDLEKIKRYRNLEDEIRERISKQDYKVETLKLTEQLLILNPEYYTIWNVRRRCFLAGKLSPRSTKDDEIREGQNQQSHAEVSHDEVAKLVRSELEWIIPLLIKFPKCYWIWDHRLWILDQAIRVLSSSTSRSLWEEELGLVGKMLLKDRRNFHAWGYRRFVVETLEGSRMPAPRDNSGRLTVEANASAQSMVESEFEYTTKMIRLDLSNFSAWHNRAKLIPRLLRERQADDKARQELLESEMRLVMDGLNVGPEDQSLWYYHQFIVLNLAFDIVDSNAAIASADVIAPSLTKDERAAFLRRDVEEIKEILEDYQDVKWIYEALIQYVLLVAKLEQRHNSNDEKQELGKWLEQLKKLDPMRNGRWKELEQELNLR